MRGVWGGFAWPNDTVVKGSYETKPWPYIESRGLRFERRLQAGRLERVCRCVEVLRIEDWLGF